MKGCRAGSERKGLGGDLPEIGGEREKRAEHPSSPQHWGLLMVATCMSARFVPGICWGHRSVETQARERPGGSKPFLCIHVPGRTLDFPVISGPLFLL